jgi:ligand-binding sensor protein
MRFETKYNVGDKVWLRLEDIESYIKAHPYDDPKKILKSCFREGHVNGIKVETHIFTKETLVAYIISNPQLNKDNGTEDVAFRNYSNRLYHSEEEIFSNFDEVTNMIKETHKNVLNDLKYITEKILKKYE